jgi:two-component system NtrC family sensor kinase
VLQALISGVEQPIIVTDAKNCIRYTNPAATALNEHFDQAIGKAVEEVIPSEKLAGLFRQLLRSGQPQRDEVPWADGRTFDANLVLVPGVGAVAVLHDVTHFKELDRIKSDFVATVSHDLKSPITVIYGYVELLREILPDLDDLAALSLEEIGASATRMHNLITTVLDLAQIESGLDRANQLCQMSLVTADTVRGFRFQADEKNIQLEVSIADGMPPIMGHPVRLGQAVANLVGNALKYTPQGGIVTVKAEVRDESIVVQVSDTGPGIPAAKQAGLFGKFYKVGTSETLAQEGHGLGLAIVRSVVEAHGGRVWVKSAIGEGSTFAFSLPISQEAE